ncbi:MAG: hypothetical protein JNK96_13740 [Betaproteobacteria bacterium]|nr:hypothetical protein [Betaproteobacteria bacterium]
MSCSYYGPTLAAEQEVNLLLGLKTTGKEQDWEIELANPSGIDAMLDILARQPLSLDVRAALCLLMLASFEEGFDAGEVDSNRMRRATDLLQHDSDVLDRMRFYWLELGRANHLELTARILSK